MPDRLLALRKYLSQPPSRSAWEVLVDFLVEWPRDDDQRQTGFDYAKAHLHGWTPKLKCILGYRPEHPCWELATAVKLNDSELHQLPKLAAHPHIVALDLSYCEKLTSLTPLQAVPQLEQLLLYCCNNLRDLSALSSLGALRELCLSGSDLVTDADDIGALTELRVLDLNKCYSLRHIEGLQRLTKLESLDLGDCSSLQHLKGVEEMKALQRLDLSRCYLLQHVWSLVWLPQLSWLDLSDCYGLDVQPDNPRMRSRDEVEAFQQKLRRHAVSHPILVHS